MKMNLCRIFTVLLMLAACILCAGCVQSAPEEVQNLPASAPLDYSDAGNWMFLEQHPAYEADLFYIYPTVVVESTYENGVCDVTEDMKAAATATFSTQGAAFAGYTNVYAPYYRQLSFQKAMELKTYDEFLTDVRNTPGKEDIFAALDYYFANCNNGRPYILAGHSQGAALVEVVLDEYMKKHPEYYKNMVAAYVIGFGVSQDWLDANPYLKFAEGEKDTGVIVSWNTEAPGAVMQNIAVAANSRNINPLIWTCDETYADKSKNKGSIISSGYIDPYLEIPLYTNADVIEPGLNDAQINAERGVLICTTKTETIIPADKTNGVFGDKSLHLDEFALFFENIRENGLVRINAFLEKTGE